MKFKKNNFIENFSEKQKVSDLNQQLESLEQKFSQNENGKISELTKEKETLIKDKELLSNELERFVKIFFFYLIFYKSNLSFKKGKFP